MRRREVLAGVGISVTTVLAGCSSDDGSGQNSGDGDTPDDSGATGSQDTDSSESESTSEGDTSVPDVSLNPQRMRSGRVAITVEGLQSTDVDIDTEEDVIPELDGNTITFAGNTLPRGDFPLTITRASDKATLFDGTVFIPGPVLELSEPEITLSGSPFQEDTRNIETSVVIENTGESLAMVSSAAIGRQAESGAFPVDLNTEKEAVEETQYGPAIVLEPGESYEWTYIFQFVEVTSADPLPLVVADSRTIVNNQKMASAETTAEVNPAAEIRDPEFDIGGVGDSLFLDELSFIVENTGNVGLGNADFTAVVNGEEIDLVNISDDSTVKPGEIKEVSILATDSISEGENTALLAVEPFETEVASEDVETTF